LYNTAGEVEMRYIKKLRVVIIGHFGFCRLKFIYKKNSFKLYKITVYQ